MGELVFNGWLEIKDKKGNWKLRKDTLNLIDRAHYNGTLIKDGKLTGNFFKFKKRIYTTLSLRICVHRWRSRCKNKKSVIRTVGI